MALAHARCATIYACVDRGQLFAYFGWVHPCRRIFWVYALIAGADVDSSTLVPQMILNVSLRLNA